MLNNYVLLLGNRPREYLQENKEEIPAFDPKAFTNDEEVKMEETEEVTKETEASEETTEEGEEVVEDGFEWGSVENEQKEAKPVEEV